MAVIGSAFRSQWHERRSSISTDAGDKDVKRSIDGHPHFLMEKKVTGEVIAPAQEDLLILTPKENAELGRAIAVAEASFRALEKANTRFIAEIEQEEGRLIIAVVPTPDQGGYERFNDELSRAFNGLSERVRSSANIHGGELLDRYVAYKTPLRVVQAFLPYTKGSNGEGEDSFGSYSETFVKDEQSMVINDDGSVTFVNVRGSQGFPDHGVLRYGYLFTEFVRAHGLEPQ